VSYNYMMLSGCLLVNYIWLSCTLSKNFTKDQLVNERRSIKMNFLVITTIYLLRSFYFFGYGEYYDIICK